ncbi:16048_t:CDS:2, partial [Funneliformis geosporum]
FVENAKACTNQVFYLDLSQSFDLIAPPWISLTQNAGIPFKSCRGTALLNEKEQTIYLFGGLMRNNLNKDEFVSNVHSLNLKSLSKIYIVGGFTGPTLGSQTIIRYNDMAVLDTAELSWLIIPASKPYAANSYTATLLSNGVIVYIGSTETREATATSIDIKIKSLTFLIQRP